MSFLRSLLACAALSAATGIASAQEGEPPRAVPVDPGLRQDAGDALFQRGKNLYDSARNSTDLDGRVADFNRAAAIFDAYLREFGNHRNAEMAWWYLGNCYYQGGHVDDGLRCFHTLLNSYGKGKWAAAAAYTLAADAYNKTRYDLALPLFERFSQNAAKPEDVARGQYYAGNCYRMTNRPRQAAVAYNRVLADPAAGAYFAPQARIALGYLDAEAGKNENALAQFREVADSGALPKYRAEAALQAAIAATKINQTDTADTYLRLILTTPGMEAQRADAQTALMNNLFTRKDYDGVIKAYRQTTAQATGETEAARLMIVARSYMKLKQPSLALPMFRDVERFVPADNDLAFQASYYRLLCFYQIEGRHLPDQVDAFLKLYRRSRPDDPRIHTALLMKAESLFADKQTADAAKAYSEIDPFKINDGPNRAGLYYQRGYCLADAGDPQGAIRSLTEFIDRYSDDSRVPSAIAKRAQAYTDSGDSARAIKDFDQLTAKGMPADLASYAWLESARLRRTESNLTDMIARYRTLLETSEKLDPKLAAEANFWIGQALIKTTSGKAVKEAAPSLEAARKLLPGTYAKHATLLLILGYSSIQDIAAAKPEIDRAIRSDYASDIPPQILQWSGIQAFNSGNYAECARYLSIIATPSEPRETSKEIWRYLGKAKIETGNPKEALDAIANVLEVEESPAWKADALVDRGRALFALNRPKEAEEAVTECFKLHPEGRTMGQLRLLSGDLLMLDSKYPEAAGAYTIVYDNYEDSDLKPMALHRLALVSEKLGKPADAENYRAKLAADFPDWKPPVPKGSLPPAVPPAPETTPPPP